MIKMTVSILMATALGCAAEVDLPLDLDRGAQTPLDLPPGSTPPLGQPAWSRTDFAAPGSVHDIAWATDGGLLATVPMGREVNGDFEPIRALTRHAADGTLDWEVQGSGADFLGALSATEGGGAVVGVSPEDWMFEEPNRPAGLDWYDADGTLTASWRPAEQDTEDMLREIDTVLALPDGGAFWAGQTLSDDFSVWTSVAGLLDAEGQLQWVVAIPMPSDGAYQGQPTDAALTADGDVVMLASYGLETSDDSLEWTSFVVRFGPDGSEVWRNAFLGDGLANGIAVAPSGNVVLAGNFKSSMTVGDLSLADDSYGHHHFVAELDPAGQAVGLHPLEVPASIDSDEIGVLANTMAMIGENLLVGGYYYTFSSESQRLTGYYAATLRLDGGLVSEMIFPTVEQLFSPGPVAADLTPDGRLALGGSFAGRVNFGEVESGEDEDGFPVALPFIAVFDPPCDGCNDVD